MLNEVTAGVMETNLHDDMSKEDLECQRGRTCLLLYKQ